MSCKNCNCKGLTSVNIPSTVTHIGEWAFTGCSGLTAVTIPALITKISDYTFYACSGLTSLTIPNSVTSIGFAAFSGCSNLRRIEDYPNPENVTMEENVFSRVPKQGTLHVLPRYLSVYQQTGQWSEFTNIVADLNEEVANPLDVNVDSSVNVGDVNIVLSEILAHSDGGGDSIYDVNCDGEVNVGDANTILRFIINHT